MHMECNSKCDLYLRKESIKSPETIYSEQSKLPSGSISISTQGDHLIIRPSSPYRYNFSPDGEDHLFSPSTEENKDLNQHQRSTTTIINDISQSYTFFHSSNRSQESLPDDFSQDNEINKLYNDLKNSVTASTLDPKSFKERPLNVPNHISSIFISNQEENIAKIKEKSEARHKLIDPVTVFCSNCKENVRTRVVKKEYTGSL